MSIEKIGEMAVEATVNYVASQILPKAQDLLGDSFKYLKNFAFKNEILTQEESNIARIILKSIGMLDEKELKQEGTVPPRVLKEVLMEGAFVEDELSSSYFAGILASSRTSGKHDDRAISLAKFISSMSSIEMKLHYLMYSTTYKLIAGTGLELSNIKGRQQAEVFIPLNDLTDALELDKYDLDRSEYCVSMATKNDLIDYVVFGRPNVFNIKTSLRIKRILLNTRNRDNRGYPVDLPHAPKEMTDQELESYEDISIDGLLYTPTVFGVLLYLWVNGIRDASIDAFSSPVLPLKLIKNFVIPPNAFTTHEN